MNFESLDIAEKSRFPFFALRIPGEGWRSGASETVCSGIRPGGFCISPFSASLPEETIVPQFGIDDIPSGEAGAFPLGDDAPDSTPRERHLESVSGAISDILAIPGLEKVVISRVEKIERHFRLSQIMRQLDISYPDAYVFCFRTPSAGLWLGASPELLLSGRNGRLFTMSLAGTRKRGETAGWSAKNIREQAIVTDYILGRMRDAGYSPVADGPHTLAAGPVEHLCTRISCPSDSAGKHHLLADALSPTPAVGGFPQHEALLSIRRNESHDRGIYGGYAGYAEKEGTFTFFVALRCMRLFDSAAALYVGGGITSESVPEEEWLETVAKSATLKSIVARCADSCE